MTRFLAPGLAALLFAVLALPTQAQTTSTDSTAVSTDSTLTAAVVVEPNPERARELFREGNDLLTSQNGDAALLKYEEALLYNTTYARAALGRAQALASLRRFDEARTAYQGAIDMAQATSDTEARATAQRGLSQLTSALDQQASATERAAKVQRASTMLQADPVSEGAASQAFTLLEEARVAGYDANLVAFYYAKALNVMGRSADAIPYAQTAVDASDGQADRSAYYIQLGLAHMGAGNTAEARAAFEAAKTGAWASWAEHYLGQLETAEGGEGSEG